MGVLEQKKQLRAQMLDQRNNVNQCAKVSYDQRVCAWVLNLIEREGIRSVHAYLPMGSEIDITPLLNEILARGLKLVAPKTLRNRKLLHLELQSLDHTEEGLFGTKHPSGNIEYKGCLDLILVPGLAFDQDNFRLGYGGGYYDGFLKQHPKALTIGLFYPFQKVEEVPREEHDYRLNKIFIDQF